MNIRFQILYDRAFGLIICCLILAALFAVPAAAQDDGRIDIISAPQTEGFPLIRIFFEPYAPGGVLISDLQEQDLQVLESGHGCMIEEFNRYQPGLQIAVAVNGAPDLNRNTGETTFFLGMQGILAGWAQQQLTDSPDDFTLASNSGLVVSHLKGPAQWAAAINAFQPELTAGSNSLQSLISALDIAADTTANPFVKRAILFITPLPTAEMKNALPNLAARAAQLDVQVSVWLVSPGRTPDAVDSEPLSLLAGMTGGSIHIFTDMATVPDFNADLDHLRYVYQVGYRSQAAEAGEQKLVLSIQKGDYRLVSQEVPYTLNLQAPKPIFIDPPSQVNREWVIPEKGRQADAVLMPPIQPLKIVIEFPDGLPRGISRSALLVDDQVVAENLDEPFDRFEWPLEAYAQTTTSRLLVQVQDANGMLGSSNETTVTVQVPEKPKSWFGRLVTSYGFFTILALIVTGLVLGAALLISSRSSILERFSARRRRSMVDPVTQPVRIKQEDENRDAGRQTPSKPLKGSRPGPLARLIRLSDSGQVIKNGIILITKQDTTFGSDPRKAACVIDLPTVEALHARISRRDDGTFMIADIGSTTGTWVNYSPVTALGMRLENGDRIHFGRAAYRFELIDPATVRKPIVPGNNA